MLTKYGYRSDILEISPGRREKQLALHHVVCQFCPIRVEISHCEIRNKPVSSFSKTVKGSSDH